VLGRGLDISPFDCEKHPNSRSVDTVDFNAGKLAVYLLITPTPRINGVYLHVPIPFHNVVIINIYKFVLYD
jgi:hypothetical protein